MKQPARKNVISPALRAVRLRSLRVSQIKAGQGRKSEDGGQQESRKERRHDDQAADQDDGKARKPGDKLVKLVLVLEVDHEVPRSKNHF
jgi:hypothetical protein